MTARSSGISPTLLLSIALCACATSSAPPPDRDGQIAATSDAVYAQTPGTAVETGEGVVNATPDATWAALTAAYAELGLFDGATVDGARHTIVVRHAAVRDELGGRGLSFYFACGEDRYGRKNADQSTVYLDMASQLAPSGSGTRVTTVVTAFARTSEGSRSDDVGCRTVGRLEGRILAEVRERVGG